MSRRKKMPRRRMVAGRRGLGSARPDFTSPIDEVKLADPIRDALPRQRSRSATDRVERLLDALAQTEAVAGGKL